METQHDVKPVKVEYCCDKCPNGKLVSTGGSTNIDPVKFYHRCNTCTEFKVLDKIYPRIEYIAIGQP